VSFKSRHKPFHPFYQLLLDDVNFKETACQISPDIEDLYNNIYYSLISVGARFKFDLIAGCPPGQVFHLLQSRHPLAKLVSSLGYTQSAHIGYLNDLFACGIFY
jgi:hypothetical protein